LDLKLLLKRRREKAFAVVISGREEERKGFEQMTGVFAYCRRFLSRGRSVKYLTPDGVINYVKEHGLYTGPSPERGTVNESKPSSLKDTADVQSNGATVSARSS
jgi:hypothetical protein